MNHSEVVLRRGVGGAEEGKGDFYQKNFGPGSASQRKGKEIKELVF